jgi:hypothetical protein
MMEPCSLRECLNAGGNPRDVLGDTWDLFVDVIRDALAFPDDRDETPEDLEAHVDALTRGDAWTSEAAGLFVQWEADVRADPSLAVALLAFLSPDERDDLRRKAGWDRHPHPLTVGRAHDGTNPRWACDACGATHPIDVEAMRVGDTPDSKLPYPLAYCAACVQIAAALMGDAS